MRIGLLYNEVIPAKAYGGIERVTVWLAEEFTKLGHEVVVFAKSGSHLPFCRVVALPVNWKNWIQQNIKNFDLDILHFQEPYHELPPVPYLVSIYGNGHPGETFLPNTSFVSRKHARNHGSEIFVYNGVPVENYPFRSQRDNVYVFMANNRRVKNLKTAVDWALDLGVRLDVIGSFGHSRKGVRFLGPMSDAEGRLEILSSAKAMICPYNWDEPFAVAPLEALACGCALISSANGSLPEVTQPEVGVICSTYDDLLAAPSKIENIAPEKCREFVSTRFSTQQMAKGYLDLYQKVLATGTLGPKPYYNMKPEDIQWLYKPTLFNRLRLKLYGKV